MKRYFIPGNLLVRTDNNTCLLNLHYNECCCLGNAASTSQENESQEAEEKEKEMEVEETDAKKDLEEEMQKEEEEEEELESWEMMEDPIISVGEDEEEVKKPVAKKKQGNLICIYKSGIRLIKIFHCL